MSAPLKECLERRVFPKEMAKVIDDDRSQFDTQNLSNVSNDELSENQDTSTSPSNAPQDTPLPDIYDTDLDTKPSPAPSTPPPSSQFDLDQSPPLTQDLPSSPQSVPLAASLCSDDNNSVDSVKSKAPGWMTASSKSQKATSQSDTLTIQSNSLQAPPTIKRQAAISKANRLVKQAFRPPPPYSQPLSTSLQSSGRDGYFYAKHRDTRHSCKYNL